MIRILTSIYLILFWRSRNYTRLYLKFMKYMGGLKQKYLTMISSSILGSIFQSAVFGQ